MQILFQGNQTSEEAAESLLSILKLFKERYNIHNFREMDLQVTLLDSEGEDVELVDSATSEVLGVFEVYKADEMPENEEQMEENNLRLIVDNTK